jgi:hypothetical protein
MDDGSMLKFYTWSLGRQKREREQLRQKSTELPPKKADRWWRGGVDKEVDHPAAQPLKTRDLKTNDCSRVVFESWHLQVIPAKREVLGRAEFGNRLLPPRSTGGAVAG